jgi:hypothetical protein
MPQCKPVEKKTEFWYHARAWHTTTSFVYLLRTVRVRSAVRSVTIDTGVLAYLYNYAKSKDNIQVLRSLDFDAPGRAFPE